MHLAVPVLGPTRTATLLGIARSSVHRLRAQPASSALLRALDLQLRMRHAARVTTPDDRQTRGPDGLLTDALE